MDKLIYTYIGYLSVFATFSTLIVAIIRNNTLTKEMRVLFLYVLVAAFVEILSSTFTKLNIKNLYLINLFTVVECTMLGLFYLKIFTTKKYSIIIYVLLFCFYGVFVYDFIFLHGFNRMNILSIIVESFILIGFSLFYFYELAKKMEYVSILANPLFWVNSSILIYFSGNLFLFIFSNYILNHSYNRLWNIHDILNIIYNTLLIIAIWKTTKK